MKPHELLPFLKQAPNIQSIADTVSTALFVPEQTQTSRHVTYSAGEKSNEFVVTVLGTALIARLEYSKMESRGSTFLAGQFSFFKKVDDKECRLQTVLRMIPPNGIRLPDGTHMDADDLDVATGMVITLRDRLSVSLLTEQVDAMEKWSFN
jgi:hypothetical protein